MTHFQHLFQSELTKFIIINIVAKKIMENNMQDFIEGQPVSFSSYENYREWLLSKKDKERPFYMFAYV